MICTFVREARTRRANFIKEEQGTAVMELVLSFPIVIFIMLLLIGMGHTLVTKQQALVAARYTAQYTVVHGSSPSPRAVAEAASGGRGDWNVWINPEDSGSDSVGQLGGGGIMASVLRVFTNFLNALTGDNRLVARVSVTPERGILPRLFRLYDATAIYVVEHDTWTCEGNRGSYLSIISSEIHQKAGGVPFLGYVTGLIDDLVSTIPCCETYGGQSERGQ